MPTQSGPDDDARGPADLRQPYGAMFARFYNQSHGHVEVADRLAPRVCEFYEGTHPNSERLALLDLCCGTGRLGLYFLQRGYRVVGLDLSEHMLDHAFDRAREYVDAGLAKYVRGDATRFDLGEQFGIAVASGSALNHLADLAALAECSKCVANSLGRSGMFVFDLNTRRGLAQRWNSVLLTDTPDAFVVNHKSFSGGYQASATVTGFLRNDLGTFERFQERFTITAFDLGRVAAVLREAGFASVHFAREGNLALGLDDPESYESVIVVARTTAKSERSEQRS